MNEELWRAEFIAKIDTKAYKEYLMRLCMERHRLRFLANYNLSPEEQKIYDDIKMLRSKVDEKSLKYTKYIWVCVNPNSLITLEEFLKVIKKAMSKIWMQDTDYLYVLEQRGETIEELGKGFHFHMLYVRPENKKYSEVMRELANTFNKTCDTSNYHFWVHKGVSIEEFQRKIGYISERKADEAKHLKQDMDILWRQKQNIQKYYSSPDFFSKYKVE